MARLSRAALETLNSLLDQMGKEIVAGPVDVEAYMAAEARLQKSTRELKQFMRPRWLRWF